VRAWMGRPQALRVFPHTKWAWRRTAKCVICEIGILFASAMAVLRRPPAFTGLSWRNGPSPGGNLEHD
jgi:hypothetical protein